MIIIGSPGNALRYHVRKGKGDKKTKQTRTRWLDVLKELTGMSLHQLNKVDEQVRQEIVCLEDHQESQAT